MTIIEINAGNIGSTGRIMLEIAEAVRAEGSECETFCAPGRSMKKGVPQNHFIGSIPTHRIHALLGNAFGLHGHFSVTDTAVLCRKLDRIAPDVLHLHNLHNDYINIPMLFRYIKRRRIPVVWTLHDCWAFTGRCPYFDMVNCSRWQDGCHECPYPRDSYPHSRIGSSAWMWRQKREWFRGAANLTIVTPSEWLASLVKKSFLSDYPVKVIHNGINQMIFHPCDSDFRTKYGVGTEEKIILGVAFGWEKRKGLDAMLDAWQRLGSGYRLVLVGTDENLDRKLPTEVISIHRTDSQQQLAQIYAAADVFLNPTREDNYPTVNMEAISCGTPVVTFDTGGSGEIPDENCGIVVPKDDLPGLAQAVREVCTNRDAYRRACLLRAPMFDQNKRYGEYLELYKQMIGSL